MKKLITVLIISIFINSAFSQTIYNDTLLAREYLNKADNFKEGSNFDNSLEYLIKA